MTASVPFDTELITKAGVNFRPAFLLLKSVNWTNSRQKLGSKSESSLLLDLRTGAGPCQIPNGFTFTSPQVYFSALMQLKLDQSKHKNLHQTLDVTGIQKTTTYW